MLSQSTVTNDCKTNPARATNGDVPMAAGHSGANGITSAANAGKSIANGLPGTCGY